MLAVNKDIIVQINKGNTEAFEHLYKTFYVYLCAIATKYVYRADTAKEITNDVFLNVWKNHATLEYPVKSYLIRAVKNRCINHLQREKTSEVPLSEVKEQLLAHQEEQIGREEHPLAYLENKEFEQMIYDAIDTLPPKCKKIFTQYLYQNKTYEEIAQINNISTSTVRVQIKIGLSKLRLLLGDYYLLFLVIFKFSENN